MADLLRIRAKNHNGLTWEFVEKSMVGYRIELDFVPKQEFSDGDVYQVELVDTKYSQQQRKKIAVVRLIARIQRLQPWQKIKEISGFWMPKQTLEAILIALNTGNDIILIGDKGTGKTTFGEMLAKALGWQDPLKVDVGMIKRTQDLFGSDAARDGSTFFVKSSLFDYIERAIIAHERGLDTHFCVILDEINRVHSKSSEGLHGLFDYTRQITIPTAEGSKIIKLPPNIHFVGTMNKGEGFTGAYEVDEALKDRFAAFKMKQMPLDYEVRKLKEEVGISEAQALEIVQVARVLRAEANAGHISIGPSYRKCVVVAKFIKFGMELRPASIEGLLGWYDGELEFDEDGKLKDPALEVSKAYRALFMRGIVEE